MDILQKWKVPVTRASIDEGYGTVRTKCLRACKSDWVMVMDADERFHAVCPAMDCAGEVSSVPPGWEHLAVLPRTFTTTIGQAVRHGEMVRQLIGKDHDAVILVRRHWHDFTWKHPVQNWLLDPDPQMRLLKNHPDIHFAGAMHESVVGAKAIAQPDVVCGPFIDHYQMAFKAMEPEQRADDMRVYQALQEGREVP